MRSGAKTLRIAAPTGNAHRPSDSIAIVSPGGSTRKRCLCAPSVQSGELIAYAATSGPGTSAGRSTKQCASDNRVGTSNASAPGVPESDPPPDAAPKMHVRVAARGGTSGPSGSVVGSPVVASASVDSPPSVDEPASTSASLVLPLVLASEGPRSCSDAVPHPARHRHAASEAV